MTSALRPLADLIAVIDEERCIGCTLCIQACPVDAIVGAAKLMHTVIAASCTGCELCVPPCPVDCIVIRSISPRDGVAYASATAEAKRHFEARNARLSSEKAVKASTLREEHATRRKRLTIARALERARARLADRKART
ncbi:MAG TPA: RnfABCDGE type electron transport complex subunit B [Burkholderiales bacterium]|nr:RnfABCDGE type electron transport complex subunit B [Burkholderiales bacterium]